MGNLNIKRRDFSVGLIELFGEGRFSFEVPEYQRGYAWENQHRKALLEDISNLLDSDQKYLHFMGTVVGAQVGNENHFHIVDGQQRLTTLLLLIAVILKAFPNLEKQMQKRMQKRNPRIPGLTEIFFLVKRDDGSTHLKFQPDGESKAFFLKLVQGTAQKSEIETRSQRNLWKAFEQLEKWVENMGYEPESLLDCLFDRLKFLFYTPESQTEVGLMFEVINNRGKGLSNLELLKNYLIFLAGRHDLEDLKTKIGEVWPVILRNLAASGKESVWEENAFLRNCWVIYKETRKKESNDAYTQIKHDFPITGAGANEEFLIGLLDLLKKASHAYVKIFVFDSDRTTTEIQDILKERSEDETRWLFRLNQLSRTVSIYPLLISIICRLRGVKYEKQRIELLELVEKLSFRLYHSGIAKRSDTGQSDLFWKAHRFWHDWNPKSEEEVVEKLKAELIGFVNYYVNDSVLFERLRVPAGNGASFWETNQAETVCRDWEWKLREESLGKQPLLTYRNLPGKWLWFFHQNLRVKPEEQSREKAPSRNRLIRYCLSSVDTVKAGLDLKMLDEGFEFPDLQTMTGSRLKGLWMDFRNDGLGKKEALNRLLDQYEMELINFALERWRVPGLQKMIKSVKIDSVQQERNEVYEIEWVEE